MGIIIVIIIIVIVIVISIIMIGMVQGTDMCTHRYMHGVRVDTCAGMRIDMRTSMCQAYAIRSLFKAAVTSNRHTLDVCAGTRVDMYIDTCVDVCKDVCVDMCVDTASGMVQGTVDVANRWLFAGACVHRHVFRHA